MKRLLTLTMMVWCAAVFAAEDDGMAEARAALLGGEAKPAPAKEELKVRDTKITAKHMEYNAKEGVAILTDDVVVNDARFRMTSKKLFVFTTKDNQLDRLVVMGDVRVDNEGNKAFCDKAVYTEKDGCLVMVGNARLIGKDEQGQSRTVSGDKITIWTNEERIEVFPNPTLTIPAGSSKGLGIGGLGQ